MSESSFLVRILAARRRAIDAQRAAEGDDAVIAGFGPPPRDFAAAVAGPEMSLIGELKRASPSKGDLHPEADAAGVARVYQAGGAAAMSVLTEPDFFKGGEADLVAARDACTMPLLWKDFVIDRYQLLRARAAGADAVLLIVRILDGSALTTLAAQAGALGLTPVVEVFDRDDLERALEAGARVVGVNHRDLETFEEDPRRTEQLAPFVPDDVVLAGFSSITTREQVAALGDLGVRAVLVGEALMRAADPAAKIRELLGTVAEGPA